MKTYKLKKNIPTTNKGGIFDEEGRFLGDFNTSGGGINDYIKLMMKDEDLEMEEWFEEINTVSDEKAKKIGEFVERSGKFLYIKGKKELCSTDEGSIIYTTTDRTSTKKLSFTICNLSDLEYGDVFIEEDIEVERIDLDDFEILVVLKHDNEYRSQYLNAIDGKEFIDSYCYDEDIKVIKINRS